MQIKNISPFQPDKVCFEEILPALLLRLLLILGLFCIPRFTFAQTLQDVKFDVAKIPFSRYGAYMALSAIDHKNNNAKTDLHLDELTGENIWSVNRVLKIEPINSQKVIPVNYEATPLSLKGTTASGALTFYFETPEILHILSDGPGVRLSGSLDLNNTILMPGFPRTLKLRDSKFMVTVKTGKPIFQGLNESGDFSINPENHHIEVIIEQFHSDWLPKKYTESYEITMANLKKELAGWQRNMPSVPSAYQSTGCLAAYVNWSCMVKPCENITRFGMLMSKNWMYNIWSWDNCFNAMSLSYHLPKLSWDEFMLPFDHQDKTGALPDYINAASMVWRFRKPPVQGWTLTMLMKQYQLSHQQLKEIYPKLSAWTNYWFIYRDGNHNGMPEYYHGNDSGWDNSTAFDMGFPAEGPDLAAFLIIQMDLLADIAAKLGNTKEAAKWKRKADITLKTMIATFWNGEKFISKHAITGKSNEKSQSLMAYLPIVLGKRLPVEIRNKMIAGLKQPGYLNTPYGVASESPQGQLYEADGYWRGPIWAPTTLLIIEGLKSLNENDFAHDLAQKFCNTCKQSGFAENFDALTGAPLRDPAYTWTSSVFLILAHDNL